MHERKLFGTATVGTKGQVVIPATAREELGINTGDRLYVLGAPKKGFVMLMKEDELDKFIEHMNFHIEEFKNIKKS
ncbi:MAG: AbrB/MazE/SpoVT family DNA-binding domain-containing protein [Candidatus Saccharibacteria bacterium]|nr:AbrB/MazE/SpoVT family DNA-binding domain-containing protein [Candidatus Saccharibacteria bacterium]